MSDHRPWAEIKRKTIERCRKLNADGQVCEKRMGTCIHNYVPTLFGAQTKNNPKGNPNHG